MAVEPDDLSSLHRQVLDACPLAGVMIGPELDIRHVNRAGCELMRADADAIIGQSLGTFSTPDQHATVGADLAAVAAAGGSLAVSARARRPDGSEFDADVTVTTLTGADGRPIGAVAFVRDVRDRPAVVRELRRQLAAFEELADASDEGMYRLEHHPRLRYTYLNAAGERMLDCSLEELQDVDLAVERVHPVDREHLLAGRRDPAGTTWPKQLRWRRRDGSYTTLWVREVVLRDPSGRLSGVVGLVRDISARERLEARVRESLAHEQAAAERLRRIDDMRQTFLRAVSHELRTPLTAVVGYAETLRYHRRRLDDEQADALVERLTRNAIRLRSLLDDLLDIDRLSRGTLTVDAREVDLAEVVLHAIDTVDARPGQVRVSAAPSPAVVDRAKLERIVDNLVGNALKHGGPDVTVWVRVSTTDGQVLIEVADDGPGVPDDVKERVFLPFEQGPASASAASPGTGLGLTLVREFTWLHGGTVELEDSDAGGAAFVVRLPRVPAVAPATDPDQPTSV